MKKITNSTVLVWIMFASLCMAVASGYCTTVVTVDQTLGRVCECFSENLAGEVCEDLQCVLTSITNKRTVHNSSECLEVRILPGNYTVSDFLRTDINLKVTGTLGVSVTFNFSDQFDPKLTEMPQYIMQFSNSDSIELRGIEFHDSPGIIAFENVTSVGIENCTFRYFFQGAVDLYNCDNVVVSNCTFEHNGPASVIKREEFRGHAGGLSLGYFHSRNVSSPIAKVTSCVFHNNTSDPLANIVQSTSQLFQDFVFSGRGGGCAITINPMNPLNATFEDCYFKENFARSFGGGLYVGFSGNSSHVVVVGRTVLVRNKTPGAAGGLEIGFVQGADEEFTNQIYVYDSMFMENEAAFGGGVYLFSPGPVRSNDGGLSNFAYFDNCTFEGNTAEEFGAAIGMIGLLSFVSSEAIRPMEITDCTFIGNNGGRGGAMSSVYLPIRFLGYNKFMANRGRTVVILGSHIRIHGQMEFSSNNGIGLDEGALYVTSLGQLELFAGANITFDGNKGNLGAALVVDTHTGVPEVQSKLAYNPLCVLLYEDPSRQPDHWENVSLNFRANKASVGSAVYINNIELCSWVQFGHPSFDSSRAFRWNFVHFDSDGDSNIGHDPDIYNPRWFVQTPADEIMVHEGVSISAFPGESFEIPLQATDELGQPTTAFIRLEANGSHLFDPGVVGFVHLNESAIRTLFYVFNGETSGTLENVSLETVLTELSIRNTFTLNALRCPPGYSLFPATIQSEQYSTCKCNYDHPNIVDCDGRRIILEDGLWGTADSQLSLSMVDPLVAHQCPARYCQCVLEESGSTTKCYYVYDSNNPDSQCDCDREGILCGSCKEGKGFSALLNKCVTCDDASGLLIAALIIVDVLVILALLFIRQPFPSILYPCLFYLQVLPYLTEHFPVTFEKVHAYVYYVSSGLGMYFIYDFCLYSNMNPVVSYFLRYLPIIIATIVCSAFGILRRYCTWWFLRKISYGISWVFLLLYTPTMYTTMSILNCPRLPGEDGDDDPRWYPSGDVTCFNGGHAALGLLAIFILAYGVLAIPVLLVYAKGWLKRPEWLRRSIKPFRKEFREGYEWWTAVELTRRLVLLLFVVSFPGNEYPAILVLAVIIAVYGFIQPYKNLAANIVELFLSLDTVLLLLLKNTEQVVDQFQNFSSQSVCQESTNTTCQCDIDEITSLTWLLLPLYCIPLLATFAAAIGWITVTIRLWGVKKFHTTEMQLDPIENPAVSVHATTSTVVDLKELEKSSRDSSFSSNSDN